MIKRSIILLGSLALSYAHAEEPAKAEAGHCHTVTPSGEVKNPVFITTDEAKKEAQLTIVATLTEHNYGMNFNGFAKGEAGYEIPAGWKVKVKFCNNSPVPHSLIVVEVADAKSKINLGEEPFFQGASTPSPLKGTTNKEENFEFTVDEAGAYAFACGFPTHSANGHWIRLDVKKDLKTAAFIAPEAKPAEQPAAK
jgi:plastocyanin